MCNVPPKFYHLCRLCLSVVSDSELIKLSLFDNIDESIQEIKSSDVKSFKKNVNSVISSIGLSAQNKKQNDSVTDIPDIIHTCLSIKVYIVYFFLLFIYSLPLSVLIKLFENNV